MAKIEGHPLVGLRVIIPQSEEVTPFYYESKYHHYIYEVKSVYNVKKGLLAELYIVKKITGKEGAPPIDREHANHDRINIYISMLAPLIKNKETKLLLTTLHDD